MMSHLANYHVLNRHRLVLFTYLQRKIFFFKKYLNENWITNIPKEGEHIYAGDPIFSIYLSAPSESELISKLRENISKLGDYYSFYDIVI